MKCTEYDEARNTAKTQYYTHGSIFSIVNKLLQRSTSSPLPAYSDPAVLANEFTDFFESKILKIHNFLTNSSALSHAAAVPLSEPESNVHLSKFGLVIQEDVTKILASAPVKLCPLDHLPAKVFKKVSANLLPVLTKIVNSSLSTGEMLTVLKKAMINPILK